jgi:hypothetical protein
MKSHVTTGAAFAATAGIAYGLCTVAFWLWPDAAASFMNALFHGLDFRRLQAGTTLFSFGSFLYAAVVLMAWAFAFGSLFGWFRERLSGDMAGGHHEIAAGPAD